MQLKKLSLIGLALIMIWVPLIKHANAQEDEGISLTTIMVARAVARVNLRPEPSLDNKPIRTAEVGEAFLVREENVSPVDDGTYIWIPIVADGQDAWVAGSYVVTDRIEDSDLLVPREARVIANVNLRTSPSLDNMPIRVAQVDETFRVREGMLPVEKDGYTWLPIVAADREAWVASSFVEVAALEPGAEPAAAAPAGEIETASAAETQSLLTTTVEVIQAVNLRETPSTVDNTPIRVARVGETFVLREGVPQINDGTYVWIPIVADGQNAWVAVPFVSVQTPIKGTNLLSAAARAAFDTLPAALQQATRRFQLIMDDLYALGDDDAPLAIFVPSAEGAGEWTPTSEIPDATKSVEDMDAAELAQLSRQENFAVFQQSDIGHELCFYSFFAGRNCVRSEQRLIENTGGDALLTDLGRLMARTRWAMYVSGLPALDEDGEALPAPYDMTVEEIQEKVAEARANPAIPFEMFLAMAKSGVLKPVIWFPDQSSGCCRNQPGAITWVAVDLSTANFLLAEDQDLAAGMVAGPAGERAWLTVGEPDDYGRRTIQITLNPGEAKRFEAEDSVGALDMLRIGIGFLTHPGAQVVDADAEPPDVVNLTQDMQYVFNLFTKAFLVESLDGVVSRGTELTFQNP
ncbi:MAG: SH3 domain-containing protein [Anaerolineae bacterium]|nr:SH3 domain-containing protein [Anaerolineae bacterium]